MATEQAQIPADSPRHQRADAARNRQRLLAAASEVFRERGIEAGVGDIAERAGVGRATLFRNFPTKQDLVVAVMAELIREAVDHGRAVLESAGDNELLAPFVSLMAGRQQTDRALFEVVAEEDFLSNADVRACHAEIIEVLDAMIAHDQARGFVREGIGAIDVLMLIKGACAVAEALADAGPESLERHVSLILAAIAAPGRVCPLHGTVPTLADLERAHGICADSEPVLRALSDPAGRSASPGS
jgi:AcrR family transcriptional regulator